MAGGRWRVGGVEETHKGVRGKENTACERVRGGVGGAGVRGVTPRTPDRPGESVHIGEAPGGGGPVLPGGPRGVQGTGKARDGPAGEALQA